MTSPILWVSEYLSVRLKGNSEWPKLVVCLVYSVYLVCPVLVWFNQTHETDQIDWID